MDVLISAMLPVALAALVGVAVGRSFKLDMTTLARVSIYGLLPALVLTSLAESTLKPESALAIVFIFVVNTGLLYGIVAAIGRGLKLPPDAYKSLIATTIFANVGNMGLPFVLFSLGEAGLERAIVYLVGSSLLIATVFPILLKGDGIRAGINVTLRLPVFWAAMAGIALQASQVAPPQPIERGIALLADGAIPLALLTLGIQLSQTRLVIGGYELLGTALRLIVSPLLAYSVGHILGLTGLDLQVVTLQAAMPVAVNSLIWVTEFGGDRIQVARTIVLSTSVSFFTLPTILWLSGS